MPRVVEKRGFKRFGMFNGKDATVREILPGDAEILEFVVCFIVHWSLRVEWYAKQVIR